MKKLQALNKGVNGKKRFMLETFMPENFNE